MWCVVLIALVLQIIALKVHSMKADVRTKATDLGSRSGVASIALFLPFLRFVAASSTRKKNSFWIFRFILFFVLFPFYNPLEKNGVSSCTTNYFYDECYTTPSRIMLSRCNCNVPLLKFLFCTCSSICLVWFGLVFLHRLHFFVCIDRARQGPRQVLAGDRTACPRATGRLWDGPVAPGRRHRVLPKNWNQSLHGMQGYQPKIFRSRHAKGHGTAPSQVEERSQTRWVVIKSNRNEHENNKNYSVDRRFAKAMPILTYPLLDFDDAIQKQ